MEKLTSEQFDSLHPNASFTPPIYVVTKSPKEVTRVETSEAPRPGFWAHFFSLISAIIGYTFILAVLGIAASLAGIKGFVIATAIWLTFEIIFRKSQNNAIEKASLNQKIDRLEAELRSR